jgi:putative SOS response-associated peptidase YedK
MKGSDQDLGHRGGGGAQPVILTPDDFDFWLTGTQADVEALYRPYPADRMAVAAA